MTNPSIAIAISITITINGKAYYYHLEKRIVIQ